jgi:gliding motility-associated-like protein
MRFLLSIFILFIGWQTTIAQELVINGGAELPPSFGWTQLNPVEIWKSDFQVTPHSGTFHFYPENTVLASSELYQDISLSSYSTAIDAGTANFTFSGWRRGYPSDFDQSRIVVEYRDASNAILVTALNTASSDFSVWTVSTDTRNAPVGTRSVRIRLISTRLSGSDNDGYYDDISFIYNNPPAACTPPTMVTLSPAAATSYCIGSPISISGIASPANANYYYRWYKNSVPMAAASTTNTPISIAASVASDAGIYTLRVEDGNAGSAACYTESSVTITIDPKPTPGTISANQEICLGDPAAVLTGTASTGGVGARFYQWDKSTVSSAGPWSLAQGYSAATGYAPGTITTTTYYRRIDAAGVCAGDPTNVVTIRVNNDAIIAPITPLVRDTICVGENFQLTGTVNTTTQPSINGGYYYSWRKMQGATSVLVSPPSATLTPYPAIATAATLADSGRYYLIVQDGPLATFCKDSVMIRIGVNQAPTTKAIIGNHQEFCLGDASSILTETNPSVGSIGTFVQYQWYSTSDTTGTPSLTKLVIAGTNNSYDPGTPSTTNYFVRKDSIKYCSAVATNFLQVRVNNTPILDSIRPTVDDTLCENFGEQFQLKGYIDSLTAGKQSINGGFYFTWAQLQEPATTPTVVSPAAPYTDYPAVSRPVVEADSGTYYLIVQDGPNATECLDTIFFKMTVYKTCVGATCSAPLDVSIKVGATSSATLCTGNTLVLQKDVITLPSTPPTFGYTYSWVRTNTLGTVVVQAPSATYQDLIVNSVSAIDSGRYQLIVRDGVSTPSICSESSTSISIVVTPAVTQALIGNDTIICPGSAVLPFVEITANTGGTGVYSYQWESSTDNIVFTSIAGATNANYQSPVIASTSYFRRADQSSTCPIAYSDTLIVSTLNNADAGTITTSNPTLCYNSIPTLPILSTGLASGGTGLAGTETYQWQQSSDNLTWIDIIGANTIDYTETSALINTMYYRRKVGLGPGNCDTVYTSSVSINVYAPLVPGNISPNQNICEGNTATITELTVASGGGIPNMYSYQWIESIDKGITWTNAAGISTLKDYTSGPLADSIWYKRIDIGTCSQDSTNTIVVDVDTLSHPFVTITDGLICESLDITFTATATNAGLTPSYQWQQASSISGPWTNIPGANTSMYLFSNAQMLDSGNVFKVIVSSSDFCNTGPDDTTVVLRVQQSTLPIVTISTNPTGNICDTLQSITYTATPVQGQGTAPTYQWYNGATGIAIAGETNPTYTPSSAPTNGDQVYVTMMSDVACANPNPAYSNIHILNLARMPRPILARMDSTICSPNYVALQVANTAPSGSSFQWYRNGVAIAGATASTYTVLSSDIPGGVYTFEEATSTCSATASDTAFITIIATPSVYAGSDFTAGQNTTAMLQGTVSSPSNFIWTPSTRLSDPHILNPVATIQNTITYTLYATDPTGQCSSASQVTITVEDAVVIPNVITINGDGVNDTWKIGNIENFPNATIVIYNRWGNLVWLSTNNVSEWAGTNYRNGEVLPDGTYFYIVNLKSDIYPEPYTGYIQLIK